MRTWTVVVFLIIGLCATAQAAGLTPRFAESPMGHGLLPVVMALGLAMARKVR